MQFLLGFVIELTENHLSDLGGLDTTESQQL